MPRRFAPLSASMGTPNDAPQLKGIVFDMDGTLCLPQNYMFGEIRQALDIPKSQDILDHVLSLSEHADSRGTSPRSRAQNAIKEIELRAMKSQKPQPGLNELITYLARHDVKMALCTRNFELPVNHLLENHVGEEGRSHFHPLITRETEGIHPKPSPEGIWACVMAWEQKLSDHDEITKAFAKYREGSSEEERRRKCEGVIMVGDSADDIEAGSRAAAATVLLVNEENKHLLNGKDFPSKVDLGVSSLSELVDVLENGFSGRN